MARLSARFAFALACAGFLISTGAAHATCAIPVAGYQGGAYGAEADTAGGCFVAVDTDGGTGATTAAASSTTTAFGVSYSLASSADLATGELTALSGIGIASVSIWDTFTFSGLPVGGATVTAMLGLSGTLTGLSYGNAELQAGPQTDFGDGATSTKDVFFNTYPAPASFSLSFNVENGTPETVLAEIFVAGDGAGGVADFGDPPTLSLSLPAGASVTTASGLFVNFTATAAPEPSTWAMMVLGLAGLGFAGSRARRLTPFG